MLFFCSYPEGLQVGGDGRCVSGRMHAFFQYSIGSMGRLYIYLHEWLIFMVNVAKYTSPMDPMRYSIGVYYVEANLY